MYIFDFDDTLFNTQAFKHARLQVLKKIGVSEELYKETYVKARNDADGDFVYSDKNYIESFSFGTPKTQQAMLSFYFNNLDILQRFIDYFKTQSFDLFKQADKERLLFPTHMTTNTNFNAPDFSENQRIDLLMSIRAIKKHHHLTEKELCCLKHLAYGKSIKEIASILNNSPRTIETHLSNIKAKIGCFSKSQMLDVYFKQYSSIMDTAL